MAETAENNSSPAAADQPPVRLWNIANVLTVLRIALVPAFVAALIVDGGNNPIWRWAAAVIFSAAAITDRFDGHLARSRGLVTDFGKIADPIADKALIGAALVALCWLGELWWWVAIVILVREIGITLLRFAVIRYAVIPASRGGKLKTVLQITAILMLVVPIWWLQIPGEVVMAGALIVTVATGVDYCLQAVRLVRAERRTARGAAS